MTDKTKFDRNRSSRRRRKRTAYSNLIRTSDTAQQPRAPKLYFGLSLYRWLFLYGLFAATAITWIASQSITQYKLHGPVAFQNGFPGDLTQWVRRGGWENILFEQDGIKMHREIDKASLAVRTFALTPSQDRAQHKLKVTGRVNTITKKPANDSSGGGAVMVWLQDDNDKVVKYVTVGKIDGLSDHYEVNRTIGLTENVTGFSFVLANKKTSAEFALVDASVWLVSELPTFSKARIAIFLVWSIILLIVLYYLFTHGSKATFAAIATVISLIIIGVLMPETIRAGTVKPVYDFIQNLTGLAGDSVLAYAYKVGHFIFFFLCTLLLLLHRKTLQLRTWEIYLIVVLFAIATEGLQLYLLDRSTRITDLFIDFSAIVAGAILATVIVTIKAIASQKKSKPPTAV